MNHFTPRNLIQRVVLSLAAGVGGLVIGYLAAHAIGAAPVLMILAGVGLWFGAALLAKRTSKPTTGDNDSSSGVETLASL